MNWKRTNKKITEPIGEFLEKLIQEETEKGYTLQVSIGTDSQRSGRGYKFATVILITTQEDLGGGVLVGRGGIVLYATYQVDTYSRGKAGVNERMLLEVSKSIEVAYEVSEMLDLYGIKLEIHADINPDPDKGLSNSALSAAVGYILGMGYDFKVKPESAAATYAADRLC